MRKGYLNMLHFFGNILMLVLAITGLMAIVDSYLLTRTYLIFNLGMIQLFLMDLFFEEKALFDV